MPSLRPGLVEPVSRALPILLLALSTAVASPLAAQRGSISGRVVEDGANTPLAAVQVSIPALRIGMVTTEDGRFVLREVPLGSHELRARRIGYSPVNQTVTVVAGQPTDLNLVLAREALSLDAIVVTGTAGESRRREVGNAVAQINLADLRTPVTSVDNLLQAKTAGIAVSAGSGVIGNGAQIRLRGVATVSMSTQPLIYVDGVRILSDGYRRNQPTGSTANTGGISSPLDDINPSDIERVEIIKGPAATTLYGTEAAAGVIQIFTKTGTAGRTTWTVSTNQGATWLQQFGPASRPFYNMEPYIKTAHQQTYDASVSGGTGTTQFYLSGGYDRNEGVLPNDAQKRARVRGNLNFSPVDRITMSWNTAYTSDHLDNTLAGNSRFSLTSNVFRLPNNFIGGAQFLPDILKTEIRNENSHFISGLSVNYQITNALSSKLTVGYDRVQSHQLQIMPFGVSYLPTGSIYDMNWTSEALTFDYVGNLDFNLGSDLNTKVSWGGQSIETKTNSLEGQGTNFPGPGEFTVSGAATKLAYAEQLRVINAGFFGQTLFGFRNRYFLTLGVRVDGNSAFGEDFGLQAYPKASFSYVLSDEAFWPEALGQVKLRGAYGHAGRAPGAFDAVRTWQAQGLGPRSAFLPNNVGAPDLGPERTAELEIGFDGSFMDDRLGLEFTHFRRKTTDALFSVSQAPSGGFSAGQLENVGVISSRGIEVSVRATPIRSERFTWDIGTSLGTLHSRVDELGGAAAFTIGSQGFIDVGHEVPSIRGAVVDNPDALAEPIIRLDVYRGPNEPTLVLSPYTSLTLPGGIYLSARGELSSGHYVMDNHAFRNQISAGVWPFCDDARAKFAAGQRAQVRAIDRARCDNALARSDMFVWPAKHFKLRELSLSVPVGRFIPRASSATVSVSARNLVRWINKDCICIDPEVVGDQGISSRVRNIGENIPTPASFVGSLRIVF